MKTALKRFFPVLTCVLVLIATIIPVSAADVSEGGYPSDVRFYNSIFPVDNITYFTVGATPYWVKTPYPGDIRMNAEDTGSDFFACYQDNTGVYLTNSQVYYHYTNNWDALLGESRPLFRSSYRITNAQAVNTYVSNKWDHVTFSTSDVVMPVNWFNVDHSPVFSLSYPVDTAFEPDDSVSAEISAIVYWYDNLDNTPTLRAYDYSYTVTVTGSQLLGTSQFDIALIPFTPVGFDSIAPGTFLSVETYTMDVSLTGLEDERVYFNYSDIYDPAEPYTSSDFLPAVGSPTESVKFFDWLRPALSGLMDTPFMFGWTLSGILGITFAILFIVLVLKYFAGG